MKNSFQLFQLIKSLSMSEKRYFKLSCSVQKGMKNYLKLFDTMEAMTHYDEHLLKKKIKDNNWIKRLDLQKIYLYRILLKSLRDFHSSMSVDIQLRNFLNEIEILYKKGLFKQCEKTISKVKHLAEKYEKHLTLLELSGLEIKLIHAQSYHEKTEKRRDDIFNNMFAVNEKWKNEREYLLLQSRLFMVSSRMGQIRDDGQKMEYNNIMNHPLLKSEDRALSYKAKYNFYLCFTSYYLKLYDFVNAHFYGKKLVALMESHPNQVEDNPQMYIVAIQRIVLCQLDLKKYKDASESIKKLKEITTKSETVKSQLFYLSNNIELKMHIETGEFKKGVTLITQIKNTLNDPKIKMTNWELPLYYTIARVYFGVADYVSTNAYLNKILNVDATNFRNDLQCFARILSLIVHIELGKESLLEYTVRSTYRFLFKRKGLYKFESIILDFIRKKLPKTISSKDMINAFKELKVQLEKISKDPFEREALDYFDFISWLESKIENRSFAEIVKEKVES